MNQLEIYFNTTNLEGAELRKSRLKVGSQNTEVLDFFVLYHYKDFTPAEVYEHFQKQGKNYPITSIRRAITTLSSGDTPYLESTGNMRMGLYGAKNYTWRLRT